MKRIIRMLATVTLLNVVGNKTNTVCMRIKSLDFYLLIIKTVIL